MSLMQSLLDVFESIFRRSSPEVQKKQQLKKLDAEIKTFMPVICGDGNLMPNFGEAIYSLYKYTRPLDNLFLVTVTPTDIPRQHRFEAQLILTGYDIEEQNLIDSLSYENRKREIIENQEGDNREYDRQRRKLETVIKALNTEEFKKMDRDILNLRQFVEFCHFNFLTFMQLFDHNFIPADLSYKPTYTTVELSKAVNLLEDLYYLTSTLALNSSTASAVIALAQLKHGGNLPQEEKNELMECLKKISYVVNKVIPSYKLKALIRFAKEDVLYEPKSAVYAGSPRQEFADMFQGRFNADEKRIKTEVQTEQISQEVEKLFEGVPLETLSAYNDDTNKLLQDNTALALSWIFPMRILKTFSKMYIGDGVKALLNDIVIEGFFNNSGYKTSFSSTVYSVIAIGEQIAEFEASFDNDKKNSVSVLKSYVLDSHKDKDFYKKLESMVFTINNEAQKLLQSICSSLFALSKELGELIEDAKKPSSEIISNIKVLFLSSRNKDNANTLEKQYPNWKIFFEIMKNYVIINTSELQS